MRVATSSTKLDTQEKILKYFFWSKAPFYSLCCVKACAPEIYKINFLGVFLDNPYIYIYGLYIHLLFRTFTYKKIEFLTI